MIIESFVQLEILLMSCGRATRVCRVQLQTTSHFCSHSAYYHKMILYFKPFLDCWSWLVAVLGKRILHDMESL